MKVNKVIDITDYKRGRYQRRLRVSLARMRARGLTDQDFLHAMRDADSPPLEVGEKWQRPGLVLIEGWEK